MTREEIVDIRLELGVLTGMICKINQKFIDLDDARHLREPESAQWAAKLGAFEQTEILLKRVENLKASLMVMRAHAP